jgi:transposase
MSTVFSGLSPLVIDEVSDQGTWIRILARTPGGPRNCLACGTVTSRVHAYEHRVVADVPLDARRVAIVVAVRRLKCVNVGCVRQTFRE